MGVPLWVVPNVIALSFLRDICWLREPQPTVAEALEATLRSSCQPLCNSIVCRSSAGLHFVSVFSALRWRNHLGQKGQINNVTLNRESLQVWINEIKQKTEPSIIPDVEDIKIGDKTVVIFSVQEYPVKPVSFQGRYYKRIKNANHQMSANEIAELHLKSINVSWDAYPYLGATVQSLDFSKIGNFIEKVNSTGRFSLLKNDVEALEKLSFLKNGIPTNAAMILFSKENLRYNVHIGRFKTPSTIIDDKLICGNLYDIIDESMLFITSHIKFAFEITGETTQRTEIPEYPMDGIRELLLNSLVHRNYQSLIDIQIKIFDTSISFFNPSGLFGNLTVEDLKTDSYQASTRNKLIAEALYLTNDIEKYGSGFIRIRKAIADYPTMKFEYKEIANGFYAELNYTTQKERVPENQLKIIGFMNKNPQITIPELAYAIGISEHENIAKLKIKGHIERIGPDRGGHWRVRREED